MVEVLKRGKLPEEMFYVATCRHCSSLLRFKRSEATYVPDQRDGDYLSLECPVCSQAVTVSATLSQARTDYRANHGIWKD